MTHMAIAIFLGALISIATIALIVLLGVWTYRDAQSRGMVGILWTAIVVLVPSYVGLIIYLIVRMDNNKVTCSNCNMKVNSKNKFCSNCGVELVPVVDLSQDEETFRKSQRNILVGFFSTLAAIVVFTILMVSFMVTGALKVAGDALEWVSDVSVVEWENTLEDALGDLDVLFDEDEIHVQVNDQEVVITDKNGNKLVHVDGNNESVDVNVKDIKQLMDKYHIRYYESDEELKKEIEDEIREAVRDTLEDMTEEE